MTLDEIQKYHVDVWKASCYLYIVESTSGHIKIGISNNPVARMRQLTATQGPYIYQMIDIVPMNGMNNAKRFEKFLHKKFNDHRVRGEWFKLDASDLLALGAFIHQAEEAYGDGK